MKISQTTYLEYFDSLLKGDRDKCAEIVLDLLDKNVKPADLYENIFQRSMYRIGKLWEQDKITIGDEHIASEITNTLIDVVCSKLKKADKIQKKIIITCIEKEFHCIGAKIIADYFDFLGWEVIMMGANTPVNEVLRLIDEKKPDLIGISNSFYLNLVRLLKFVDKIKEKYPDQKVIIGGQALSDGKDDLIEKYGNVRYVSSIKKLDEYLR
ncbi:B12-binding domain-containing protein [Bacteroidota bacterium]